MSAVLNYDSMGFRPMRQEDLPKIMEIEVRVYLYPWTLRIFRDCLHVGYCCWIYELNNEIQTYYVMAIGYGEAHILNLCVRPEAQRKGLGSMMLSHMMALGRQHKVDTLLLEVRPSNAGAVSLYHKNGFNEVGLRKAYYPGQKHQEDALIMARSLKQDFVVDG